MAKHWCLTPILLLAVACGRGDDPVPDANGVIVVPDELSCPKCTIANEVVATLEVPADTTDDLPIHVEKDAQGRTWVLRQGDLPVIFDSTGRFNRVLGRTGQGPGEYYNPWSMLILGRDSILIMDQNRRGTLSDSTLTPREFMILPVMLRSPIVVRWPDVVVGNARMPNRESQGPLYQWSFANKAPTIVQQFTMLKVDDYPELTLDTRHRFSTPRDEKFWAIWNRLYALGEFGPDLTRKRLLERQAAWFPGASPLNYNWKAGPPPPHIAGLEEDDEGLLWVFLHVGAPTWKEAWPQMPEGVREIPSSRIQHELLYTTRLEVIDPRRARVVSRMDIPRLLVNPLPGRRAAFYHESDRGNVITIIAFDLTRR